jgi:putative alpha-1,2-mannosidase
MTQENIEGLIKGLGGTRSIIKKLDRSIIKKLFDTQKQSWSNDMVKENASQENASRNCKPRPRFHHDPSKMQADISEQSFH